MAGEFAIRLFANPLIGNDVYNQKDEHLGDIKEIMLDVRSGSVSYAVLFFSFPRYGLETFRGTLDCIALDTRFEG